MLPSFRLIAATFLCGFFVVFAGLRLATSLNDIHEGLPVMAAHAAPVSIEPAPDREARRSSLFTFIFAGPFKLVADGQLHLFGYFGDCFFDSAAQIAALHAIFQGNVAGIGFPVNFRCAVEHLDVAQLGQ